MIIRDTNIKRALQSRSSPKSRQRGYLLNPYNFGAPQTPGDPHWSGVSSYMPMDGAHQGTVFTDAKSHVWNTTGSVTTINTDVAFSQCANFDGGTNALSVVPNAAFTFGTGDFAIEARAFCINHTFNRVVFSFDNNRTLYYASNGSFYFYDGSSNILTAGSNPLNLWVSWALVRKNGVLTLFKDGVVAQSVSFATNLTSTNMFIGNNTAMSGPMYGYLDEFRVTKGAFRYDAPYTPAVGPFPIY